MNLVQINERLKNLPTQTIQQYANGMNPEVPPYLALGELQRREISQKQAATAQGGAQGPQPSVKEQMEQKAGLMQVQQMQQQQMAQQQQQPRGPMPAPAGIPQPEEQPQAAMAGGGLASVPLRRDMFDYAEGGIIAFQVGGKAPRIQDEVPITEEEREKLKRELLMRLVGEEARNPPSRTPPMEMTESDMTSIPGMEQSDLMAKEMRKAAGPQRDNRAMLNRAEPKEPSAPYSGLRYESLQERAAADLARKQAARQGEKEADVRRAELVSQIPAGGPTVTGGEREEGSEFGRNIKNTLSALPGASASRALSGGQGSARGVMAALAALSGKKAPEQVEEKLAPAGQSPEPYSNEGRTGARPYQATPVVPTRTAAPRPAPELGKLPPPPERPQRVQAIPGAPGVQSGLPAAAGASPFIAEAAEQARKAPTAPTPAGIIAEQAALSPASMQEAAMQKRMEDQRARAGGERAAYEKSRPSGLDELIRMLGQSGQYKGLSGMGPAYTAMQQQRRAEDLGMERRQNELLTAIEGREYEGGKELFGARTKSMDAANKAYQDRLTNNTKTLADLAGVDQRRIDEVAQRLTQKEIAKMQAATAARPSEAERIEAKYMKLKADGKVKEADEYLNTISTIKGSGVAGVGAGRNKIMERRQEMKELEGMAKNEMGQYSDADAKWAAARITQLAKANAQEGGEGGKTGEVDKTNPLLK